MENTRVLNQQERRALQPIEQAHGIHLSGGSCSVQEDGSTVYHVGFDGMRATYGTKLGEQIKEILRADKLILSLPGEQKVV